METIRESSRHFITPGRLLLTENALGNPDLIQATVSSGCTVTIVDTQHFPLTELEQWPQFPLSATDIKLNAGPGQYYIYIVVPTAANTQTSTAFLGYSSVQVSVTGHKADGTLIGKPHFCYYPAGTVSAHGGNPDAAQGRGRVIQVDLGRTPPAVNLPGDLNDYDKIFQIDKVDPTNVNTWLLTILREVRSMVARTITVTKNIVFGTGSSARPVTGVAVSADAGKNTHISDSTIATTAWVKAEFLALDDRYLRRDIPDSTSHLLSLLGGAEFQQTISSVGAVLSMLSGKGTILTADGHLQLDTIEVRQSLKVIELIINRLQGMENDFVFSPTRKVLRVESIDATTYKLFLDPKMTGDLIPFRDGNIVYSIVNDLLTGGSNYYTSYSRILSCNQNEYSVTVSLYPDSEVPGGKNYAPVAGYNISRRGHVNLLTNKEDAQSWYLSSSEGRLLFLQNVVKPVLDDYNYALSVGKIPRIQAVEDINLPQDAVGVMAETIVAQHIYQYDYNGDVVPSVVDRGQWSLAVAQSADKPYRNITAQTQRPNGTKYTLLEQHAAWRWGCKWGCLRDKTTEEPRWNAQDWVLLEGDNTYSLHFDSSEGWQFFRGRVHTVITMSVTHASEDITHRLITAPGTEVVWLRDSGNVPADNTWQPTFVGGQPHKLQLTNADMPSEWGLSLRKVKFVCKVYIPDGAEPIVENEIDFQI